MESSSSSSTQGAKALLRGTVAALALSTSLAFVTPSSQSLRPAVPASSHRVAPLRAVAIEPPAVAPPAAAAKPDWEAEFRRKQAATEMMHVYPDKHEVIVSLEPLVEGMLTKLLLPTGEKAWQPSDFVPDLTKEGWEDEVKEFREKAETLPDETLVVLVGDMVTEEALPTYQTLLNTFEGVDDPTGTSPSAWCKWTRGWTSEENRHGDLLNRYLYLTGRVDMRAVECTIQHLISSGFNPKIKKDPYKGFVYTSFQERATKISHQNVARLANNAGDGNLGLICSKIAGDESRHEKAYQAIFQEILKKDPEGGLKSFWELMSDQITMPAVMMTDGHDPNLFEHFSVTAQKLGVYTAVDYANILEYLVETWDIEHMGGLSSEGQKYQEKLCKLAPRYMKLAEMSLDRVKKMPKTPYSWIHGRVA